MRVDPYRQLAPARAAKRAPGAPAGEFAVNGGVQDSAPAMGASAPAATAGIDALLALQTEPEEPRRRQLNRGRQSLDALDRLTLALLDDADASSPLSLLRQGLAGRGESGDAGLDEILRQIDVRAAVELAKRETAQRS